MTDVCLFKKTGEVLRLVENVDMKGTAVKPLWLARLVVDCIADRDIDTIKTIVNRIDGLAPAKGELEEYANIMGSALTDVLDLPTMERLSISLEEPVIISLAKVVVAVSMCQPGKNPALRRMKNAAIEMIFTRCGGRTPEPVRPELETRYEEPEWMKALPSGDET